MAMHAPIVHPQHVPAAPSLAPLVATIVLIALLGALFLVFRPAETPAGSGAWMSDQRHGEIDAGRNGPHVSYLIQRAGEINAANE